MSSNSLKNVYPNTLKTTNLGEKQPGNQLSIELDPVIIKIAKIFQKFNHSSIYLT